MSSMATEPTRTIAPAGFFVLRTPLLPFSVLTSWARPAADATPADAKLILESGLKRLVAKPEIRESLLLASPTVYDELDAWLADDQRPRPRLQQAIARYVQRMASRPTPFGLFAACSVGTVGTDTYLTLGPTFACRRYSRMDGGFLFALTEKLQRDSGIRTKLRFAPNSSLYQSGGRWRYVETLVRGGRRKHVLVAVEPDDALDLALRLACAGLTLDALVERLSASLEGSSTTEEIQEYVLELVNRQVLTSDLTPIVTGPEALDDLLRQCEEFSVGETIIDSLKAARLRLRALDASPLGTTYDTYCDLAACLKPVAEPIDFGRLVQVDLVRPAPGLRVGQDVVERIIRGASLLARVAPKSSDSLRRFKDAFIARYDRQYVPMLEVLDQESGIGFEGGSAGRYIEPLLNGLAVSPRIEESAPWRAREAHLLERVAECNESQILELTAADIERLSGSLGLPLPDTCSVVAVIGGDGPFGREVMIRSISGPSGANMLGRFCHAEPMLCEEVRRLLRHEEHLQPHAVFAEIVHLPDGRLDNILARPLLRGFEIAYLGRSGASEEAVIPASDLLVTVQGDRVVLWSKRLDREVVPRLATAHNFSRGQAPYRFLCSLQHQGVTPWVSWSWGPLDTLPVLPRVSFQGLVFCRARWRLDKNTTARLAHAGPDDRCGALRFWRDKFSVPRFVVLADADNELPVDLENPISVDAFLSIVKKRDGCLLVEMFPAEEHLFVRNGEGAFSHEIILPLVHSTTATPPPPRRGRSAIEIQRTFLPGSEWLYLKLFAGPSSVDRLLLDLVPSAISAGGASGVDRWFFLRYGDPDWHLRLRCHGSPEALETLIGPVREAVKAATDRSLAWRCQHDTYEREVERYGGGRGTLLSEEFFWRDSEAATSIIGLCSGDGGLDARWRLCLVGWDSLLTDFCYSDAERKSLVSEARRRLLKQIGGDKRLDHALGTRFRRERKSLEELLDPESRSTHPLAPGLDVWQRRSVECERIFADLRGLDASGHLSVSSEQLLLSYLHMSCNRLLRSDHRMQELVLFDFLGRLYESRLARARGRGSAAAASVRKVLL